MVASGASVELSARGAPVEWLWHVTEDDVPIGRIERARAHAEQLRHRSGIVFLLDADPRVYLTRRAADKSMWPDCHDSSASFHVTYGESYAEAAAREAAEELGFARTLLSLGSFQHDDPPERQWVGAFAMAHDGSPIVLDPTEASGGTFVTLAEAQRIVREERCTPWLRDGLPLLLAHCARKR